MSVGYTANPLKRLKLLKVSVVVMYMTSSAKCDVSD